jgi:alpha-ketoglutaric semialdehyde dehydrogenase
MEAVGAHRIGGADSREGPDSFRGLDPATTAPRGPAFAEATAHEIDRAARLADAAFPTFAATSRDLRAALLERVAAELEALGDAWLATAHAETALPLARLTMERGRTCNQLRLFAGVVRDGAYLDVRIDRGDPTRKPLPKPDVRRINRPLGPVAVFGASNFPLAFSVAGGDTASALAAGCPVIVKGHPAHPATCELAARAIDAAVAACGLPAGVFALLHGRTTVVGESLVDHPLIAAVGFTGSLRGGRALADRAAARSEPIPVFAEMGSINPVFLLPGALARRGAAIAEGLAASTLNGVGQFCTKPGVVVLRRGPEAEAFLADFVARLSAAPGGPMLAPHLAASYRAGVAARAKVRTVETLLAPKETATGCAVTPSVYATTAVAFRAGLGALRDEIFGPTTLVVHADDEDDVLSTASSLPGSLTATIHAGDPAEAAAASALIERLARRAGRIVFDGYPTGVEVCAAMHHGGPYPATTHAASTSVGSDAIRRWLRPVAYQDAPAALLPPELRG